MSVASSSTSVTPPQSAKILVDAPSVAPALGFDRTARALAQIITDSDPRFAIGLFGGWGSGKTTLMQAIQAQLPPDSVVVEFNAWRFEREPQLLVPLIDTVRAALVSWSTTRDTSTQKRIRGVTIRIARVVRGLAAGLSGEVGVPGAVKVKYDVGKAMDVFEGGSDPDQPQSLYFAAFQELSLAFEELGDGGVRRVVVFVDDLDRCLPANALDVLESMKLFFDLPGFVFVVGLDEGVVQRAVRARFFEGADAAKTPGTDATGGGPGPASIPELERDYIEKIFQVPYRLPPMVAEQLEALLETMYLEANLPATQLNDFRQRVAPYLSHIAVERQVNPRQVKRFLNTYTLQTLVRPGLDRDVVLALQTLIFRYEWRPLYDAILTDSLLFIDALTRYRDGEDSAFEDLSPELRVLPADLGEFLRSDFAEALRLHSSLDSYLSSLESTSTSPPWLSDAYRDLGRLRGEIRRVRLLNPPGEADRRQLASIAVECSSKLTSTGALLGERGVQMLGPLLQQLERMAEELQSMSPNEETKGDFGSVLTETTDRMFDMSDRIYRELRTMRDSSMFLATLGDHGRA